MTLVPGARTASTRVERDLPATQMHRALAGERLLASAHRSRPRHHQLQARVVFLVVVALVTGCMEYAHRSMVNAPGVAELATPLPHENGDPERFEPASDPGAQYLVLFAMPYIAGGRGRYSGSTGSREGGIELRFEHATEGGFVDPASFAVTAGFGFAQWGDGRRTTAPGAFYAELDYRFVAHGSIPLDVGIGPAYYVDDSATGGQITLRIPTLFLRTRYMQQTGTEVMVGFELPFAFLFGRSR